LRRGELDDKALLSAATDSDKMSAVRCYLGLDHVFKGQSALAREHFLWVKDHGNPRFTEHAIHVSPNTPLPWPSWTG